MGTFPIYVGLRVTITQNRDKNLGVVNGAIGVIARRENHTLIVRLSNNRCVSIYQVTRHDNIVVYPLTPVYCLTICKYQGQTLNNVLLYLDTNRLDKATTYVALSRVQTLTNLKLITPILRQHLL